MKSNNLLPHFVKKAGWFALIPSLVLGILVMYAQFEIPGFEISGIKSSHLFGNGNNNLTNELSQKGDSHERK